ncbi:RusA-like Holliday junction resolvase [Arthrobacter phage Lizalica]|uniref:Holliday junction resolvase n=1 Tax=Arthrobacter phage Lizalica TaxID=2832319 RepID=A0AA49B3J0_9CAUD|nr:RusA-like Holliday junction resolvase [Arthrobacter phage Lizalica]UIW13518.1 holliday junction resolvase [Arthrobacter phage Lizalica]
MSAAKSKGTAFETLIVKALAAFFGGRHGLAPRRVAQEGFNDSGDIHGVSPFIIQAKAYKSWEDAIRLGLDGAEKQKGHAGEPYGVAFVKRPRRSIGDAYAVMTVATFARLLLRLRRAEAGLKLADPAAFEVHASRTLEDSEVPFPKG